MDKKQKQNLIVALLVIAILLSLTSIAISVSLGTSGFEFRMIQRAPEDSTANIGVTIEAPVVENGI